MGFQRNISKTGTLGLSTSYGDLGIKVDAQKLDSSTPTIVRKEMISPYPLAVEVSHEQIVGIKKTYLL